MHHAGPRDAYRPEDLPGIVPVFPLSGVLLLPRGKLPLRIFEPRYLAMTDDAIAGDRLIAMAQPCATATVTSTGANGPPLYGTACAGRITSLSETEEGHYLMTLTGIARFTIGREMPLHRGYRRVAADWSEWLADLGPDTSDALDRERLVIGLKAYFRRQGLSADWDAVRQTPDERLVTSLAMICPFEPNEKQALLEAKTLSERATIMMAIIEMAVHDGDGDAARH